MIQLLSSQGFWFRVRQIAKRMVWISAGLFVVMQIIRPFVPDQGWRNTLGMLSNTVFWVVILAIIVWVTARLAFWWLKGRLRWGIFAPETRRAHLLGIFDDAIAMVNAHELYLIRVIHVYQVARRGTKCIVEHPDGVRQDAWFWSFNPKQGCVFMVRASNAYGPHHHRYQDRYKSNAHVMYVGSQVTGAGVVGGIPAAAWKAARKRMRQTP